MIRLLLPLFLCVLLIGERVGAITHDRFIVVTPEKTGTHLLTKAIGRLVEKEVRNCWAHYMTEDELVSELLNAEVDNKFLHVHAYPTKVIIDTLKKHHYKVIFLIRDPRDTLISLYYYIEGGWEIGPYKLTKPYGLLSFEEKIDEMITGSRFRRSMVKALFVERLYWMDQSSNFVYTARFENLVGHLGGGRDSDQLKEVVNIAKHIRCPLSKKRAAIILDHLWGPEAGQRTTFRKGVIGNWKQEFSEEHKKVFQQNWGWLLQVLKYEPCYKKDLWQFKKKHF